MHPRGQNSPQVNASQVIEITVKRVSVKCLKNCRKTETNEDLHFIKVHKLHLSPTFLNGERKINELCFPVEA
jgi:hypothetical protein